MKIEIEVTDTFGGEANYGWVRRYSIDAPETTAQQKRAIKKASGYTGTRGRWEDYSDVMKFTPRGQCVVVFGTFTGDHA